MNATGQHAGQLPAATGTAGPELRDLVVVGGSAGGVAALRELVRGLPGDLPAAVLAVVHMAPGGPSALASILRRAGAMDVIAAEDMTPVKPGYVYVAQPDCHLLVRDGTVRLSRGPRENGHRPAVDPLFRSAARWYATRTVAVVLSGTLDDGAAGAAAIARRGGAIAVQDPADAMFSGMPGAALRAVSTAAVAPLAELPGAVTRLVQGLAGPPAAEPDRDLVLETDLAELDETALRRPGHPGTPSPISCPDCHGVLNEISGEPAPHYRCQVGHAWSEESLEGAKDREAEAAIWVAVRTLEERTDLYRELAGRARAAGRARSAAGFEERHREATGAAEVIRELLASGRLGAGGPGGGQGRLR